jgi:hypothetical protein
MRKFIVLILSVLALTLVLSGCGGGGGSTPGKITATFHFQDQTGKGIKGLALVYTDPNQTSTTSAYSDDNGNIIAEITIAGSYSITTVKYDLSYMSLGTGTITLNPSKDIPVDQADINRSKKVKYTVPITINTDDIGKSSIGTITETEI